MHFSQRQAVADKIKMIKRCDKNLHHVHTFQFPPLGGKMCESKKKKTSARVRHPNIKEKIAEKQSGEEVR